MMHMASFRSFYICVYVCIFRICDICDVLVMYTIHSLCIASHEGEMIMRQTRTSGDVGRGTGLPPPSENDKINWTSVDSIGHN